MAGQPSGRLGRITHGVTDLVAVIGLLAVTALVVVVDAPAVVRVPAALVSVLFLPGYAATVALFPVGNCLTSSTPERTHNGITLLERGVLAIGLSLALVVLQGLALDALVGRLTTATLLTTVVVVTAGLVAVATVRRRQVPAAIRYEPTLEAGSVRAGGSALSTLDPLTVALVLAVLFAGGAIAAPGPLDGGDDGVTEFYLLTAEADGSLQASDYPTDFTANRSQSISVAVEHAGETPRTYTVVGQLQRAERGDDGAVVRSRERIATRTLRVGPGETRLSNESVTVTDTGSYRLVYLLYRGDAPADPRIDNADRELHLWITVTEAP